MVLSLTKEQVELLSTLLRDVRLSYQPDEPWADREECKRIERILEKEYSRVVSKRDPDRFGNFRRRSDLKESMATAEIDWLL